MEEGWVAMRGNRFLAVYAVVLGVAAGLALVGGVYAYRLWGESVFTININDVRPGFARGLGPGDTESVSTLFFLTSPRGRHVLRVSVEGLNCTRVSYTISSNAYNGNLEGPRASTRVYLDRPFIIGTVNVTVVGPCSVSRTSGPILSVVLGPG